jgi:membrane-anchored protein YejM (alkaline phosphatase superfamily)
MICIVCLFPERLHQTRANQEIGAALRNWTLGNWVNGTKNPSGAPSLYGADFQTITWAQQNAGYLDAAGDNPNKSLANALHEADARLGTFLDFLQSTGKLNSTLVLIGSKQGQGPINPKTLKVSNPDFMSAAGVPVAFFVGEDGGIVSTHLLVPTIVKRLISMANAVFADVA